MSFLVENSIEQWKDIEGYVGKYQVSSFGRVKSLSRLVDSGRGGKPYTIPSRILKPASDRDGYLQVRLCLRGNQSTKKAHRLVAYAFLPAREGKYEVNHKDKDTTNNRVTNLEWCDREENVRHQFRSYFIVEDPSGIQHEGNNIKVFAENNNLTPQLLSFLLRGSQKTHKGWKMIKYVPHK